MYKYSDNQIMLPHEFFLPFGGKLNPENRWCKLATLIPWADVEEKYAKSFKSIKVGQVACSVRIALGSLVIQNHKSLSDRETLEEITENPYLQFFIGLPRFIDKAPFDPSLMVHFRKRLGKDIVNQINEMIANPAKKSKDDGPPNNDTHSGNGSSMSEGSSSTTEKDEPEELENQGKLILDATCAPADIHFPTDIWLLNKVREALEDIIDVLHQPHAGTLKKPRTYRNSARRDYLNIDKKKHRTYKEIRKGIRQQLGYIKRDLSIIETLAEKSSLTLLGPRQYRNLLVGQEIYRQQLYMYQHREHKIQDRIVSLHMPFIRPIVRGKTNTDVEFGAKLAISIVNGFSYMETLSFDAFNEGTTLQESAQNYKARFGYYPEAIIVDKIYRNRDNLQFCKKNHIRLSGPPLGRPAKDPLILKEQQKQETFESGIRNAVEGKFGEAKRSYGLGRIMTRLQKTSESAIALQLLVMNLEHRLRLLLYYFFKEHFWQIELSC
jgi:transposase, IS5 family